MFQNLTVKFGILCGVVFSLPLLGCSGGLQSASIQGGIQEEDLFSSSSTQNQANGNNSGSNSGGQNGSNNNSSSNTLPTVPPPSNPVTSGQASTINNGCPLATHLENNLCYGNERICNLPNGKGVETWSSGNYGSCQARKCNIGYHPENASCLADSKSCPMTNGTGVQYWNWNNSRYDNCTPASCNPGFQSNGGSCIVITAQATKILSFDQALNEEMTLKWRAKLEISGQGMVQLTQAYGIETKQVFLTPRIDWYNQNKISLFMVSPDYPRLDLVGSARISVSSNIVSSVYQINGTSCQLTTYTPLGDSTTSFFKSYFTNIPVDQIYRIDCGDLNRSPYGYSQCSASGMPDFNPKVGYFCMNINIGYLFKSAQIRLAYLTNLTTETGAERTSPYLTMQTNFISPEFCRKGPLGIEICD
ncbi:MAG: hypothetical protein K1X29_06805 [Bdellovibrionales bacterium]|nr:hypothetical protein [Bdellovibrionales bacterium]